MKQRILLVGSDGHDLLNRISTLDVSKLELGVKTLGLILNPQGKIRCSFLISKKSPSESEIDFESPFLEVLDQYTFAEKYEIRPLPSADGIAANESERIQKLLPRFGKEYLHDETTNPLEINLRSQIHDGKGCYPGQEVIEKIISLGSPAKKLALLESVTKSFEALTPLPLLDPITHQEVGTLTSFSEGHALGILKRTHLKMGIKLILPQKIEFTITRISE